ncbi:hypothetical protein [Kineococcus sp. SYSU DK003]|uniref:hypothetical protein n=1 Tax=Kineococcus sp. SYSU DK003 TaxID=3383124 RepID=UPI003D7D5910
MPNGGTLPFGPYTVGQFLAIVALLAGGFRTMPLWGGHRGLVVNAIVLGFVIVAVVTCMRQVPWRGRGPLPILRGALFGYSRTAGSYRGKALPGPHTVTVHPRVVIAGEAVMDAAYAVLTQQRSQGEQATAEPSASPAPVLPAPATSKKSHVAGEHRSGRPVTGGRSRRPRPASSRRQASSRRAAHPARTALPAAPMTPCPLSGVQRLRARATAQETLEPVTSAASSSPGSERAPRGPL